MTENPSWCLAKYNRLILIRVPKRLYLDPIFFRLKLFYREERNNCVRPYEHDDRLATIFASFDQSKRDSTDGKLMASSSYWAHYNVVVLGNEILTQG